jgi:hypothetical protein
LGGIKTKFMSIMNKTIFFFGLMVIPVCFFFFFGPATHDLFTGENTALPMAYAAAKKFSIGFMMFAFVFAIIHMIASFYNEIRYGVRNGRLRMASSLNQFSASHGVGYETFWSFVRAVMWFYQTVYVVMALPLISSFLFGSNMLGSMSWGSFTMYGKIVISNEEFTWYFGLMFLGVMGVKVTYLLGRVAEVLSKERIYVNALGQWGGESDM